MTAHKRRARAGKGPPRSLELSNLKRRIDWVLHQRIDSLLKKEMDTEVNISLSSTMFVILLLVTDDKDK